MISIQMLQVSDESISFYERLESIQYNSALAMTGTIKVVQGKHFIKN